MWDNLMSVQGALCRIIFASEPNSECPQSANNFSNSCGAFSARQLRCFCKQKKKPNTPLYLMHIFPMVPFCTARLANIQPSFALAQQESISPIASRFKKHVLFKGSKVQVVSPSVCKGQTTNQWCDQLLFCFIIPCNAAVAHDMTIVVDPFVTMRKISKLFGVARANPSERSF